MSDINRIRALAGLAPVQSAVLNESEEREMKQRPVVQEAPRDDNMESEFLNLVRSAIESAEEAGAYGDVRDETVEQAYDAFSKGDYNGAAEMILADFSDQDGGEVSAIEDIYQDLVDDFKYIASATNESNVTESGGVQSIQWPELEGAIEGPYGMHDKAYRLAQTGEGRLHAEDAYSTMYSNFSHETYEDQSADGKFTKRRVEDWLIDHRDEIIAAFASHGLLEADVEEGNAYTGALAKAKEEGEDEFEVDGEKHKVKESEACPECGCDPCECDDDLNEESEEEIEESLEEISEAPTMDTTQLVNMMRNAGLSEETITQKLEEWANTPEGVGEVEPREHGGDDNYAMAQAVNLSLKKYLDAQDMKVQVTEHTAKSLTEAYKAYKGEVVEAEQYPVSDRAGVISQVTKNKPDPEDIRDYQTAKDWSGHENPVTDFFGDDPMSDPANYDADALQRARDDYKIVRLSGNEIQANRFLSQLPNDIAVQLSKEIGNNELGNGRVDGYKNYHHARNPEYTKVPTSVQQRTIRSLGRNDLKSVPNNKPGTYGKQ